MDDPSASRTRPGHDGFLSYARDDDPRFRDELLAGLKRAGLRIWFDRDSLPSRGTTFDQEIRRAIESSARLVLLVGESALSRDYVAQEWGFADDLGIPVIPVIRSGSFTDLPLELSGYHAVPAQEPRSDDDVVAELVRLLSDPVVPLATCHGVPRPPAHELGRPDLVDRLQEALGVDRQRPADAGRAARCAALYGTSGIGKSTVAAAFARSTRTRRTFSDGIAWVACGSSFHPLAGARQILEQVAAGARLPSGAEDVPSALAEGLAGREVLVVLDDVRDVEAAAPFAQALGPEGRMVVTALDQAVGTALGAADIGVGQLDDVGARTLLQAWADGPLPGAADEVLEACEGLPFALAIVGAMIRNRTPWQRVVDALSARRLDLLAARFPGYPYPNVLRALAASYDALAADEPNAAACYLELAAFRPGAVLPEAAMIRLWSRPGRLDALDASFVLPVLERRLLVQRRPAPEGDRFALHGLHEDFVRMQSDDVAALEADLVDSYRRDLRGGTWSDLPDDGYLFDNLVAHLHSLGARAELVAAVDSGWVHRQLLRRGDPGQALDDVEVALDAAVAPEVDLPAVAGLSVLAGQVTAALREAPPNLVGALAEAGDTTRALHWAADKPDADERFDALVAVIRALVRRGELARARQVVRTAADTIPQLGGVVETGWLTGLTALNAVHLIVDFPAPDEWEGSDDQHVAMARIPLDALVRLAPIAADAGALAELAVVTHPFWELYGHLIPLVAVEQLADEGDHDVAAALLDERQEEQGEGDLLHAALYRRAIATAAVGRFAEASAMVAALPAGYQAVGHRGLARHLAKAGRVQEAVAELDGIDDATVAAYALQDVVEATIDGADPQACRFLTRVLLDRDWVVAAAWVAAAGGDTDLGLPLLDSAAGDDLRIALGVRLGEILHRAERHDEATQLARRLVPVAESLLGPQWYAPETTGAQAAVARLGDSLRALLVTTGEPLPDGVTPLSLIYERQYGELAPFKMDLIVRLAMSGRLAEATDLAGWSALPGGRAFGLGTAMAVAGPAGPEDVRRRTAERLLEALDDLPPGRDSDHLLGAAMRGLLAGGLREPAGELVQRLVRRQGLWSAVGVWAQDQVATGHPDAARALVRQLLIERSLPSASPAARAEVLAAVATRRATAGDELAAAGRLLTEHEVATRRLDVVFDVVRLTAQQVGLDEAAELARAVAGGRAADLAETLLTEESITWDQGPTEQEIALAAVARAVAAAAMVLSDHPAPARKRPWRLRDGGAGRGAARGWLQRADDLAGHATRMNPATGGLTARFLAAARAAVTPTDPPTDPAQAMLSAWLLWDSGRFDDAARHARRWVATMNDPLAGSGVVSIEAWERRLGMSSAADAALKALIAMQQAMQGRLGTDQVEQLLETVRAVHWLSLGLAERALIQSQLAIALHRLDRSEEAVEELARAAESAELLARRGELLPFPRLCRAVVELLPAGQAALTWAQWLVAAAAAGTDEALSLTAAYIRWLPPAALDDLVVSERSGGLMARDQNRGHPEP